MNHLKMKRKSPIALQSAYESNGLLLTNNSMLLNENEEIDNEETGDEEDGEEETGEEGEEE